MKYPREIWDHREINSDGLQSQQGKDEVMNKSKFGAFSLLSSPPLQFLKTETSIPGHLRCLWSSNDYSAKKPSELEVENNDYRAEDVIPKVKE